MNDISAPIFRKAGRGYNKDDVNAYILALSRHCEQLQASNAALEDEVRSLREALSERSASADISASELEKIKVEAGALSARVSSLYDELQSTKAENERLKADLEAAKLESEQVREAYSKVCSKAGEILALAGDAADDILQRAGGRAHEIIDDAKVKKDDIFRSITATADDFTDDIERYIKSATQNCMDRINESIAAIEKTVGNGADVSVGEVKERGRTECRETGRVVFVDGD